PSAPPRRRAERRRERIVPPDNASEARFFIRSDGQHLVLNVTTGTKRARAARKSWWALARRSAGLDSTPHGAWRSLVAHPLWERKVAGSNPAAPIRHHWKRYKAHIGRRPHASRSVTAPSRSRADRRYGSA